MDWRGLELDQLVSGLWHGASSRVFTAVKRRFRGLCFLLLTFPWKNRIAKIVPGISSISIPCLINNLINSCAAESFTHKGSYQVSIPKSGRNLGSMQRHVYLSKNRSTSISYNFCASWKRANIISRSQKLKRFSRWNERSLSFLKSLQPPLKKV